MNLNLLQTFGTLLIRDVRIFQQHVMIRMIDACVWAGSALYVSQYILPEFGIDQSYASFLVTGNLAVWGMFEVGTNMSILLGDLLGNNSMSYYLSLPLPSSWIFIRVALMDAYKSIFPTLPLLPLSKLILGSHFSFSSIHYPKLIVTWILAHIFFGFFGLFVSSITHSFDYITTIRQRVLFPLWFLGCYQFTWHMLYDASPRLAYLNLINPVMYIMEAMRGCSNTTQPTLPYSWCILATLFFTLLFAYIGIKQFKKRLDCI